jgi:predicted transcriptional regulator
MNIVEHAREYCARKQISKTPIYACQRVAEVIGEIEANQVTQQHVEQYVQQARKDRVPEWTIKGAVKDLRTIVIDAGGPVLLNTVKKPKPDPKPCEISDIDTIWQWLAPWSCQLIVLTYWCGIRLEDAIRLQLKVDPSWRSITWEANKTGHRHRIPAPKWLSKWLQPVRLPYKSSNDHAQVIVRGELDRVCTVAGIPRILPSTIRDRGITEWSKVSSDAGALLHGHGLGTRDHYVPALEILTAAMDRVRVPTAFGAAQSSEDSLLSAYRRLDPSAQGLVSMTAERLAAG